jgi:hypothetical protein
LVFVPCPLACVYAVWRGDWQLAVIAGLVVLASERRTLPAVWRKVAFGLALAACAGVVALNVRNTVAIGAAAIVGFWLFFELGWWAGADALAAITLALLWPGMQLLAALALAHLGLSLVYRRRGRFPLPRALNADELETVGQPGLPALALTVAIYEIGRVIGLVGGRVTG